MPAMAPEARLLEEEVEGGGSVSKSGVADDEGEEEEDNFEVLALREESKSGRKREGKTHNEELSTEEVLRVVEAQCAKELLLVTILSLVIVLRVKTLRGEKGDEHKVSGGERVRDEKAATQPIRRASATGSSTDAQAPAARTCGRDSMSVHRGSRNGPCAHPVADVRAASIWLCTARMRTMRKRVGGRGEQLWDDRTPTHAHSRCRDMQTSRVHGRLYTPDPSTNRRNSTRARRRRRRARTADGVVTQTSRWSHCLWVAKVRMPVNATKKSDGEINYLDHHHRRKAECPELSSVKLGYRTEITVRASKILRIRGHLDHNSGCKTALFECYYWEALSFLKNKICTLYAKLRIPFLIPSAMDGPEKWCQKVKTSSPTLLPGFTFTAYSSPALAVDTGRVIYNIRGSLILEMSRFYRSGWDPRGALIILDDLFTQGGNEDNIPSIPIPQSLTDAHPADDPDRSSDHHIEDILRADGTSAHVWTLESDPEDGGDNDDHTSARTDVSSDSGEENVTRAAYLESLIDANENCIDGCKWLGGCRTARYAPLQLRAHSDSLSLSDLDYNYREAIQSSQESPVLGALPEKDADGAWSWDLCELRQSCLASMDWRLRGNTGSWRRARVIDCMNIFPSPCPPMGRLLRWDTALPRSASVCLVALAARHINRAAYAEQGANSRLQDVCGLTEEEFVGGRRWMAAEARRSKGCGGERKWAARVGVGRVRAARRPGKRGKDRILTRHKIFLRNPSGRPLFSSIFQTKEEFVGGRRWMAAKARRSKGCGGERKWAARVDVGRVRAARRPGKRGKDRILTRHKMFNNV
ncbi:hypothetical protein B0H19DRAFT_1074633 [Mycena capillaripes]|nr:hypothetical protein B0H19DRAFT_1074633 [Mycena capillaripes]